MKTKAKFVTVVLVLIIFMISAIYLTSCNKQIIDVTYAFDKAIISLPNGELVEGKVDSWRDYDADQIQVKIDGTTYLVHSENIVLIKY